MPKRWIVTYTGAVFDVLNGPNGGQFSRLEAKPPTTEVVADEMQVNGGALVFKTGGEVQVVYGPTSYWLCELEDDEAGTSGSCPGDDGPTDVST